MIPISAYRLERRIGFRPVLGLAVVAGLAYGALKADNPWSGQGLSKNLSLMLLSAFALVAYAALSLGVVNLIAKAIPRLRR